MDNNRYNGWSNRETWCANLWIGNEEHSYHLAESLTRDAIENATEVFADEEIERDDVRSTAVEYLASELENHFYPVPDSLVVCLSGMARDLLTTAANRIDWHEIAESMIEDSDIVEAIADRLDEKE